MTFIYLLTNLCYNFNEKDILIIFRLSVLCYSPGIDLGDICLISSLFNEKNTFSLNLLKMGH